MALKFGSNTVNTVIFNNNDVKKIVKDGTTVWCKPYSYTRGTLPTGCSTLTCYVYSREEPSDSTTSMTTSGTIYHGDKLYWSATASSGYSCSVTYTSSNLYTVTGNISSGVTTSGLTVTSLGYTATIRAGTQAYVALGTSSTSPSTSYGASATLTVSSGTKVYAFVQIRRAVISNVYVSSEWTLISGTLGAKSSKYMIGSKTMFSNYDFGKIHNQTLPKPQALLHDDGNNYLNWEVTNKDITTRVVRVTYYCEDSSEGYGPFYDLYTLASGGYFEDQVISFGNSPETNDLRYAVLRAQLKASDNNLTTMNDSPIAESTY